MMTAETDRHFGALITRLIRRQDLTRAESTRAFTILLTNRTTIMQQGAFLGALATKGETVEEVAGAWEAIYHLDTVKVHLNPALSVADNSGTGMDTFKTFNISTAASIVAASQGVPMARHGARAITSACGTVDMAESLGVDVDCPPGLVVRSIETMGLGLFNGMSAAVHPRALGRILSQVYFGSTLNIAASLANPALPAIGLRGVYSREMVLPVARIMKSVGYRKALVVHGRVNDTDLGLDEASVCGPTVYARLLENGEIVTGTLSPEDYGLGGTDAGTLAPSGEAETETRRFAALIGNRENGLRKEAVMLNAALMLHIAGVATSVEEGLELAARSLESGAAANTLADWVATQNRDPEKGLRTLERWMN